MIASFCGFENIVAYLLTSGADITAVENSGGFFAFTFCFKYGFQVQAIHSVVDGGYHNVVAILLQAGADVDTRETRTAWTPLLRACLIYPFVSIIKF